mgnify:CR=1 FL=1
MNQLAEILNHTLSDTVAGRSLSEYGRRLYFPQGIVKQAAEARGLEFDATAGMAYRNGCPMSLSSLQKDLPTLDTSQSVAYAPNPGVADLRDTWDAHIREANPSMKGRTLSRPMVVAGLTNGLFQLGGLFVDPGDALIVPELFWGNYRLVFENRYQAQLRHCRFFSDSGGFDVDSFRDTLLTQSGAAKVIVLLNFPNNPSGYAPTDHEADGIASAISELADSGSDVVVICDDAYFGLYFEQSCYQESMFAKLSALHPRVLAAKVDGVTKEDLAWGLRVGFVTFGSAGLDNTQLRALEEKLAASIRSSVSNCSNLSQHLALRALQSRDYARDKQDFFDTLRTRYNTVREILAKRNAKGVGKALRELPFNAGYFMTFACEGVSAEELRKALLVDGIGTISFGDELLRVTFAAVDTEKLEAVFTGIFAHADALLRQ